MPENNFSIFCPPPIKVKEIAASFAAPLSGPSASVMAFTVFNKRVSVSTAPFSNLESRTLVVN